jgi:capsular exopolysaccharide synthesis family protein
MDNLDSIITEWDAKAADYSRRLAEYEIIKNKVDRIKAEYDRLFSSLRNVDITKSVDQDMVSVLERASPPYSIKPGLVKIMLSGLFGGLLLGFGILFVMDRIDDRLSAFHDVQRHFRDSMVLGQVIHESHTGPLELLRPSDPRHAFAESFRSLRSSLIFLPVEGERPKSILITSAVPGEGKSTTSSNLAIAMALSGSRTLLVDGDLRRGAIHRAFGMSNERGFAEVLKNEVRWQDAVQETPIEHLSLLSRGKAINHPGERLLSPVTDRFLKEIYPEYDYIIFDSSPVMVADDTTSLAPKADAVVCVLRLSNSSARLTRRTLELLRQRQANVLGLVVNDVTGGTGEYGDYRYSQYYQNETAS